MLSKNFTLESRLLKKVFNLKKIDIFGTFFTRKQKMSVCEICKLPSDYNDIKGRPKPANCYPEGGGCPSFPVCKFCNIIMGGYNLEHHIQNVHLEPSYNCRNCEMKEEESSPYVKLAKLLNMCDEGFKELTDFSIITGQAVAYALNDFITIPEDIDIFHLMEGDDTFDKDMKLRDSIDDIFYGEMRFYSSEGVGGPCGKYFNGDVDGSRLLSYGYPTLPSLRITVVNDIESPKELTKKYKLDINDCYYHKGEFYVSDRAQEAFDSKITNLICDGSNKFFRSDLSSNAEFLGFEVVLKEF
uniref:tRNA nucleotidyltransferase/poly(A) polymerase n=1 Tax=Pithovirus LCPAC403 TaxID=2506596 RepID=A0A481ZAS5_9VIRU|nr:MAG: tRNA nucleotidyltransferase/poly(A) polymerase [Pithovirus LCPAC403]